MKIKILAKKLSLSGIDKSLCSIVNMLSVNHEVTLVQTYKEENGTHKLNDNVKQVFLLSSEKEEKRSIVKKLLLKIKVGFLNKSVIKKEIKKNDYDVLITSNSTYVKWFKYNKMNKYKVFIENNYHLDNKKEIKAEYKTLENERKSLLKRVTNIENKLKKIDIKEGINNFNKLNKNNYLTGEEFVNFKVKAELAVARKDVNIIFDYLKNECKHCKID